MTNTTHTPGIDLDKEHALFKAYRKTKGDSERELERDGTGSYRGFGVPDLWDTWQARAALTRQAAPEAPTDDAIEHAALKHVAPGFKQLAGVSNMDPDYRNGEQFKRLKAFAQELFGSAPATQQAGAAELVTAMRDRVARIRYIDESSRKLLIQAADFIEKGTASPTASSQFAKGEHTAATTASAGDEVQRFDWTPTGMSLEENGFYAVYHAPTPSRDAASTIKPWRVRHAESIGVQPPMHYADAEIADLRAALARAPLPAQGDAPLSNTEFLSKRLTRVAKLVGAHIPEHFTHEQVAETAGTILGEIARKLETAAPAQAGDARDRVRDAISEALGDAYDCTRVWSAWGYGTMGPDDFVQVAEQDERLYEIADAAIAAMSASQGKTPGASHAANAGEDAERVEQHIRMVQESGWEPGDGEGFQSAVEEVGGSLSAEELMKIGRKWMRGKNEHRGVNDFLFTRAKFLKMIAEAIAASAAEQKGPQ